MSAHRMRGGEAAVKSLLRHGVDTLFCLPGVQNDWLFNAIYDHGQSIRVIHTRHEQGAAYMALGFALAKNEPGVFSVVPGPGVLNATAALATAYALNAKVVCLAGQIPSPAIGRDLGNLHEINDQLGILRRLTKWAQRAGDATEIPALMAQAFATLNSGRPRPVALEMPMDVLQQESSVDLDCPPFPICHPPMDETSIERAAELLTAAQCPMVFVGSGAMDVGQDVFTLAEYVQAPVVSYRTGKGVIDGRHYLSLQQPQAERYWENADVVLSVGSNMRVPLQKWARRHRPKIIRIDVDPSSHNKFARPDVAITARAEDAMAPLIGAIKALGSRRESRETELHDLHQWWRNESAVLAPQLEYLAAIRDALGEDGIFVDELTQVGFASRIAWPAYHPRTFITTGYQGTLGYGFPTALGVKVARPDVPVASVTGDGGFMFAVQELATAVQHRIPVVVLLFNNNQYGNVQQMQKHDYGGRVIASDLINPDFVQLARAYGAHAVRANSADAVATAIRAARGESLPTVVEIPVDDMPSVDQFR